jgi:signal transduction histidine kinase
MKLARKLVVAFILVVCAVFAAYSAFRVDREIRLFETDMQRDAKLLGRALGAAVVQVWKADGEESALRLVEFADAQSKEVTIRWVWLDGGPPAHAPRLPLADLVRVAEGHEVVHMDTLGAEDGQLTTYIPVAAPGAHKGALEIGETLREERAYVRSTLLNTLMTTAVLVAMFGLVAMLLGMWFVGRPIHDLIDQARRVGAGDLSKRIEVQQGDEIGELAVEMNVMCDRLAEAHEKVAVATSAKIAALEQLRHAERLSTVGKLASGIAHELGTPLNVISGRAKMIAAGELTGDEIPQSSRIIAEQSERMARIIRQLLDFARRRHASKAPRDLRQTVRTTLALLETIAAKRRVELVQAEGDEMVVEVDEGQIQQALTNLVVNGVQAMEKGGKLTVAIERARVTPPADIGGPEADYVRISVRDEGAGIPADVLAHVFEPFFTTKGVGEGTGLGLSVTYGIAHEHGGWVDAESEPGKGSTFSIYLPQQRGTE